MKSHGMKPQSLHIDGHLNVDTSAGGWPRMLSVIGGRLGAVMKRLDAFLYNEFIFSSRFRIWRHVIYWSFHVIIWATFWSIMNVAPVTFGRFVFSMILWVPVFILFGYPLAYWAIPRLLFKGRVIEFLMLLFIWAILGIYINGEYRTYIYVPVQEAIGFDFIPAKGKQAQSYLCMTTSAASPMIIKFFKLWTLRQREWTKTQQERINAELQLLKAQVRPHFLFNTLNSIYTFSVDQSPKTPGLILKLSSLLSYMLYDCNSEEARLEKEIEIMKYYIDLERERGGDRIEVSWNVEGNISNQFISPLLMLPFIENAFKHASPADVKKPWLSVDLSVKSDVLRCKIANSKSENVHYQHELRGTDIRNVQKRLAFMYPDNYQLKMYDEGHFFVVSLHIRLAGFRNVSTLTSSPSFAVQTLAL